MPSMAYQRTMFMERLPSVIVYHCTDCEWQFLGSEWTDRDVLQLVFTHHRCEEFRR